MQMPQSAVSSTRADGDAPTTSGMDESGTEDMKDVSLMFLADASARHMFTQSARS